MIDDLNKWNDLNELQKSLPGLGESVSVKFILSEIAIAEGSLSKKAEFITKYCNRKQNASTVRGSGAGKSRCSSPGRPGCRGTLWGRIKGAKYRFDLQFLTWDLS